VKKYFFIAAVLLLSAFSKANDACDMFEAELSIVQDQVKSIVEDVQSCKKLTETAADEKNKATDDKMLRLIKSAHKQADIMSHSITQISLRKECACEGFDFQLVNQKVIEVKYWIKRAKSVDLEKQKSDQYAALSDNVNKLNEILKGFSAYLYDPCNSSKPPITEPEKPLEPESDSLIAQHNSKISSEQDTTAPIVSEPIADETPKPIKDSSVIATGIDTGVVQEATSGLKPEEAPVVVSDSAVNQEITAIDTIETKGQVPSVIDAFVAPTNTSKDTIATDTTPETPIIDTIRKADTVIAEEIAPAMDTIKTTDISVVETKAIDTVKTTTNLMDTIKKTDVSIKEEEEIAEKETEIIEPQNPAPKVEAKPKVSAPVLKPKPIPTPVPQVKNQEAVDFYYAVQVAAGADRIMPGFISKLSEEVYIYEEGGLNKFRVGHYTSLNEALDSKNTLFKKGITDAFIVAYAQGNKIGIAEARNIEAGSPTTLILATTDSKSVKKKDAPKPITSKIRNKAEVFLAVQVGASITAADPIYELAKYEHQLQMRIKVIQDAPVRYYTGETKDRNEAEQTLSLVKSKGIEGAFLIGVSNGERVDYQAALEHLGK